MVINDHVETADIPVLLAEAKAGDSDAFRRLIEAHEERLFRQAVALCGNPSIAEDLAAETIIEAWKSLSRFNETCRFSTWLYAILLHRYQKQVRRAASRPIPLSWLPFADAERRETAHEQQPSTEPTPAENLATIQFASEVQRSIDALTDDQRDVIRLRFFEGASLAEIAAVVGCAEGTVKSRLHHGLEKLRGMKITMNLLRERRDT